jgi:hypothetical protein
MKRKSTTPRSFLRQLAEPVPRTAAPLIPRRPVAERGAATRSSLDAIPQIIDVTETKNTQAAEPQHTQAAGSIARRSPSRRTRTSARSESSQVDDTATGIPAVHGPHAGPSSANAADTILQSTMRESTSAQTKTPTTAAHEGDQSQSVLPHSISTQATSPVSPTQENAQLQSVLAHSRSAHAASPPSPAPPQSTAKTGKRPDISVHIGTIEVRVPAPPTRTPQPAPAALKARNTQHAVSSRASESISRSLAWSHGLVQG